MSRSKKKKINKKKILICIIVILLLISIIVFTFYKINNKKYNEQKQNELKQDIITHYNEYVITNKETYIYKLNDSKYTKAGKVGKSQQLTLNKKEITYKDEYLKIDTFEQPYYIYYKDIDIIDELTPNNNDRYKKYIVYNENVITKEKTNFYDKENNLIYSFNQSFNLPIIIKKNNQYAVEFNNQLLYLKSEDVIEIKENNNTDKTNTSGIAVLNYHFFYDETKASERNDCNQTICHSKSGFIKHLDYIKNNDIFTPTMEEFEMYLNKEINLPKSVLITIDDGWRSELAKELLEEYQINATVFLITSWFDEINFLNDQKYIEYHSHGDNIHNQGECPGGQGGAIKCKEKTKLLEDLNLSRKKLEGSTAFCYPFYEYNDYSINVLKEAGFTLAFAGGFKKATPNTDKYQIPRYIMYDSTTVNQLKSYIG